MALKRISDLTGATLPLAGTEELELDAGGLARKCTIQDVLALVPPDAFTIITESGTSTMEPATHAGRSKYVRAADDVTFNTAEGYTVGEVYSIRATAALTLIGTGVTLTPPNGGTLDMESGMTVSVIMTSSSAGDVMGQTVPA